MQNAFFYCNETGRVIFEKYGLFFSIKFCEFFSKHFELLFFRETGIKPSTKVTIGGFKQDNDIPMYQPGAISKLNLVLWIMPNFLDNLNFCWKSKSGEIVKTTDEEFDENDLECWIENLKPDLYWKEVATEKKYFPFQVNDLPFKLKVFGFGVNMGLVIQLSKNIRIEEIIQKLYDTVENHNLKSENQGRKYGVVHNCEGIVENDMINFRIDVGSAGVVFIKKLLKELAHFEEVSEVVVDL